MAARSCPDPAPPVRRFRPAGLAAGAALLWATPTLAQEAPSAAPVASGPVGGSLGGGSLADPAARYGTTPGASPVRLGAFGAAFSGAEAPEGPARAWTITPSIGLAFGATDNVFQTSSDARSDTFLDITPAIVIDGSTARIRATVSYAPSARLYATYTDQNNVAQIGSGQVLAELVPGALFLDMRGYAGLGTASGGFVPGTAQNAQRSNQVQYYNFIASPYYLHRFGSLATVQVGYEFQYFSQDGDQQFSPGSTQPFFNDQNYVANRGYAVVRSGEDLGRLALQARVDGTAFNGSGVYDGAHVFVTSLETRYAILPTVAVLLEGGYENIEYSGTNPQRIDDAIWSVGARLTPTPESFLIVRYGHRGGFTSPSLDAGIQLGGYTRLTASYAERLGTSGTLAQDLLSTTTLDAQGNPVDSQSGAPIVYANPFFASTSGLFRIKTGSVALTVSWPRDYITLFAYYQDQDPVSASPGTQIQKSSGYYGGVAWTHELAPGTTMTASVQVGRTEYGDSPATDAFSATVALSHRIGPRLSGIVQVFYDNRSSNQPNGNYGQTTILAGLSQSF